MALRLIEMVVPEEEGNDIQNLLDDYQVLGIWHEALPENRMLVRVLLSVEETEGVLNQLETRFGDVKDFRVMLFAVEASLPRPELPDETASVDQHAKQEDNSAPERISREELYAQIKDAAKLSKVYMTMVGLSSVVAVIGLLNNSVAVVIGAMVIAPLLGPNVALSLATTLGDLQLASNALKANVAGVIFAFVISVCAGVALPLDPALHEVASRTEVGLENIVLALAAGSAGTLAFTTGVSATLIGVMVAVALLPPLVVCGLLLGAGNLSMATGAFFLLFTNIICINLAGVLTFLIQGIRPISWGDADRAKKATYTAIALWIFLLSALTIAIMLSKKG